MATNSRPTVLLVVGAAGEPAFGSNFLHQARLWESACTNTGSRIITIGLETEGDTKASDLERLRSALETEPKEGLERLWLVLIGHGTFDGKEAKFNLRGPDFSALELSQWLKGFRRPVAVINTASCSGPFLKALSATNRIVVTATRSGQEQNFTRFGQFLAEALNNPRADLDKDGQTSLLEAFLSASRDTAEFYKLDGRIATEHALLDDNADGLGTPADWFRGVRAVKKPAEGGRADGLLASQWCLVPGTADRALTAEQRARRDALEAQVFALREKKAQMPEAEYYRQLEELLVQLARQCQAGQ